MNERIAVIGLGYVGLPVALAFAKQYEHVVGFDINASRVEELRSGVDRTREASMEALLDTRLTITANPEDLRGTTLFVVTVPTPVDRNKQPDLGMVVSASELVGRYLQPGAVVVYESTVYPGVTEDVCGPVLARVSGLQQGVDFTLGYSPERINPGDKVHTLAGITKVVSGENADTLERVAAAYGAIVPAGIFRAATIRTAEAAKVIENTQRDLNIALMNELALIFDRMGIRTADVLAAASTKWNFLPFRPGLVGGHCIGVDPYYLTAAAEALGYHPQVILAGRRINDSMGSYIAQRLVKMLITADRPVKSARVGILGLTFKEDVPDLRNSRVPDIVEELKEFGVTTLVHDPMADPHEAVLEYGISLCSWDDLHGLDGIILAVGHKPYQDELAARLPQMLQQPGVMIDVKSMFDRTTLPPGVRYWSL